MPVIVTVTDEDGSTETKTINEGDYCIITVDPCHVSNTIKHGNGTHVVTIKAAPPAAV